MEQLEHSESQILELGKRIVKELDLEDSVNTLGKWMAHYVAEIIYKVENCDNETEKNNLQNECSKLIIQLWKDKKHLPIQEPLSNLKPLLKTLEALKEDKYSFYSYRDLKNSNDRVNWHEFVSLAKNNTNKIFQLAVYANSAKEILQSKQRYTEEDAILLSDDEQKLIELLNKYLKLGDSILDFGDEDIELEKMESKERYKIIFEKFEELIDDQKESLSKLKEQFYEKH